MTITIGIGNSDDKLSQTNWSWYIQDVDLTVGKYAEAVRFFGMSQGDESWQNACWVINIRESQAQQLKGELSTIARKYKQDALAWTEGVTELI